jgi:mersacidin/lichenicidin family type 2 lantibiotic
MSDELTVRAWKDAAFRSSLDAATRESLQPNPAGDRYLGRERAGQPFDLEAGGVMETTEALLSLGCCHGFTTDGACGGLTDAGAGVVCTTYCLWGSVTLGRCPK